MRLMGTEGTVMRLFAHGYEGTDMRLMGTESTVMRLFGSVTLRMSSTPRLYFVGLLRLW